MAIRISGLVSGLDTDTMVQELVSAYSTKKNKYVKSKTKLEWKMDAWKDLNKKINTFYKKLGTMKLSDGYTNKTTSCSDPTKATVTASNSAINGTQKLEIGQLAKAAYITGAQLGSDVTNSTKLKDLGLIGEGTVAVKTKTGTKNITLKEDMTVKDFTTALNGAGVSANFDEGVHRMYISAKDTGLENNFALTATDANGVFALQSLGVYVDTEANTSAYQQWKDYAVYDASGNIDQTATEAKLTEILQNIKMYQSDGTENATIFGYTINERNPDGTVKDRDKSDIKFLQEDSANWRTQNTNYLADIDYANNYYELSECLKFGTPITDADGNQTGWDSNLTADEQRELRDLVTSQDDLTDAEIARRDELKEKLGVDDEGWKKIEEHANGVKGYEKVPENAANVADVKSRYATNGLTGIQEYVDIYTDAINKNNDEIAANSQAIADKNAYMKEHALLTNAAPDSVPNPDPDVPPTTIPIAERVSSLMDKIRFADHQLASSGGYSDANVIKAQDAKVSLNGVDYEFSSNSFTINGMSITALQETNGEPLTISTQNNVQGMYDKIKGLITDYNTLIKEMDSLYNATSAKGYEPLMDDEKEAMTDKEVEKWEQKIKDSILRRDDKLSSVMSLFTTSMTKGFTLSDGKTYSLASFGIKTQGYLAAEEHEGFMFRIDGETDEALSSGNQNNQLLAAIQKDPDMVQEFFQTLSANLYDELHGKMGKSTESHSIFTIYNDKTMQKEYDNYGKTIKKWEQKVKDMEEFYYKKFTAMETALSKLQQSTSALSGLLGSAS